MKKFLLTAIGCGLSLSLAAQLASQPYAETITADDLRRHLTYIASDELEGRDTGSEGQQKAAEYIQKHFVELGLLPIVPVKEGGTSYFQKFNLYKKGWSESYLMVNGKRKAFFTDYYPNGMVNVPAELHSQLVFIGYGLKTATQNDYASTNLKNKAVIFFDGEPGKPDSETWSGTAGLNKKVALAKEAGATAAFVISADDAPGFANKAAERRAVLSRYNRMMLKKPDPEKVTEVPSFIVSKELASEMLDVTTKKLSKWQASAMPKQKAIHSNMSLIAARDAEQVETMNILGFMEGTDRKDEVVVISAHYDHVGIDAKGEIYNGADDDGSGTCAILEIAEAFAKAKAEGKGPRRSILFMLFTGEEKGLLGSQYYTDLSPVLPLANTVVNLNVDMIGRIDKEHAGNEKYVYIIGSDKLSSELAAIQEETNKASVNYTLDYTFNDPKDPNRFYYRSDHYNFAKNKIPVIFYFTGVHEDYHRPGDDVEKIMFPKYTQISQLVFHTAWEVANRDKRIVVDSNKQ